MDNLNIGGVGGGAGGGITNIKVSAGTLSANRSDITFDNAGGVSFGLETNGIITASAPAAGGGLTNIKVSAGTLSAHRSDITFSNANGLAFGLETNGVITGSYTQSTHSHATAAYSGSNGSFTANTVTFGSSNGMHFYTTNGSMVGSYTVPTVPAQFSGGLSNGGNTAGDTGVVTGRVVLAGGNNITVSGSTNAGSMTVTISGPNTVAQSNQTLGLYAVGNTTGQSSSSTFDARTISFVGQGIASVGFSNGSVNISVPSGGGGLTNINVSAGTTSQNLSNVVFSNSNGISFGLNGSTITAASYTGSWWEHQPIANNAMSLGNGQPVFWPVFIDNLHVDRLGFQLSYTNASNSTGSISHSYWFAIYTKNASTLSSLHSTSSSHALTFSGTVGSWSLYSNRRFFTVPWTTTITGGEYWIGFFSSSSTGGANASLSNLGNQVGPSVEGIWGVASNITQGVRLGAGFYSNTTTAIPASVAFTQLTATGAVHQRLLYFQLRSGTV